MFNRLHKLITEHYYATAAVAEEKVTTLYAYGKITTEQLNTLMGMLADYDSENNGEE